MSHWWDPWTECSNESTALIIYFHFCICVPNNIAWFTADSSFCTSTDAINYFRLMHNLPATEPELSLPVWRPMEKNSTLQSCGSRTAHLCSTVGSVRKLSCHSARSYDPAPRTCIELCLGLAKNRIVQLKPPCEPEKLHALDGEQWEHTRNFSLIDNWSQYEF